MPTKKETYVGIADCHGIESFVPITDINPSLLQIRADANRHRHALVYRVSVTKDQAGIIKRLLARGMYKEALLRLKKEVKKIDISVGRENSWELIPNEKLDPWR